MANKYSPKKQALKDIKDDLKKQGKVFMAIALTEDGIIIVGLAQD